MAIFVNDENTDKVGINFSILLDRQMVKVILLIAGLVVVNILLGIAIGMKMRHSDVEREAIKNGFAEYSTRPDTKEIYLRWKTRQIDPSQPSAQIIK